MPAKLKPPTKSKRKPSTKSSTKTKKSEPKKKRGRPPKKKMGRPRKLTEKVKNIVVEAVRAGNYMEAAAPLAGLHKDTVYDWLKRGARAQALIDQGKAVAEDEMVFVDFSKEMLEAMAQSEIDDVRMIKDASREHWQAAAWRLERKYHKRWGKKADHVVLVGELTEEREREIEGMFNSFIEEDED